uniref:Nucleoside diphosphate kinase n=1 Tax=Chelonoidis abingdonii TaxID=106734 RepID=A0A8C0GV69_CHEAB
ADGAQFSCLWMGDLGCNLPFSLSRCPLGIPGIQERTLVAVKPDGVQRRLVGDVIKRFERRGFKLVGMKLLQANEGLLAEHYHELRRKPFYPALIHYMTSGPVVAMVWEGYNVVRTSRAMVGDTDSAEAKPGTIRGDFSIHVSRNVVHASDSVETAQREISLWFHSNELVEWDCCDYSNTYHLLVNSKTTSSDTSICDSSSDLSPRKASSGLGISLTSSAMKTEAKSSLKLPAGEAPFPPESCCHD